MITFQLTKMNIRIKFAFMHQNIAKKSKIHPFILLLENIKWNLIIQKDV